MIRERLLPTTDTANNASAPFVSLTICPDYSIAYKDASLQTYGLDKYMYRYKGVYVNLTNNETDDLQVIYDSITHDVDEIISSMTFYTASGESERVKIEFNKTHHHDNIEISTSYWHSLGKCYNIRPNAHLLEKGIQIVDIVSRVDSLVYFGYPGQLMHPNTKTKVVSFVRKIFKEIKIQIGLSITRFQI